MDNRGNIDGDMFCFLHSSKSAQYVWIDIGSLTNSFLKTSGQQTTPIGPHVQDQVEEPRSSKSKGYAEARRAQRMSGPEGWHRKAMVGLNKDL